MSGRLAWVTGGSSGIGFASAKRLAELGWRVAVSGRDLERLQAAARDIGPGALPVAVDVTDAAAMRTVAAELVATAGPIDALVANAGANVARRAWGEVSPEDFSRVVEANLVGVFNSIDAVLPTLRGNGGGRVVVISSFAGWHVTPQPGPAYTASKLALSGLVASLNMAEMRNGVTATLLCPGEVATPAMARRDPPPPAAALARMLQPEDVAAAVGYVLQQPDRVAINELVITPAWNGAYNRVPGPPLET